MVKIRLKSLIKRMLGDNNHLYSLYEGRILSHHDISHIMVSKLPPIRIGGVWVTGIDGISITQFGTQDQVEKYSSYLDECRVAIHQFWVTPSICSYVRAIYWSNYLLQIGENPLIIFVEHKKVLER